MLERIMNNEIIRIKKLIYSKNPVLVKGGLA